MLEILTGADLVHKFVFVSIHSGELSDMVKSIKYTVCELEGVDVTETVLDLRVDNEFGETEDFSHEMEGISETGFFTFLSGEGLNGLEIEVVYK